MRFFLSSAAQGVIGNGYPRPATSPNVESGIPSGVVVGGGGAPLPRPRPPPPPPARIQIPEKSTLPSAVRGVGASRFGLPSAARGTPGVGYEGHCAPSVDVTAMRMANTPAIHSLLVTKYEAPEKRRRPVYPFDLPVGSVARQWPVRILLIATLRPRRDTRCSANRSTARETAAHGPVRRSSVEPRSLRRACGHCCAAAVTHVDRRSDARVRRRLPRARRARLPAQIAELSRTSDAMRGERTFPMSRGAPTCARRAGSQSSRECSVARPWHDRLRVIAPAVAYPTRLQIERIVRS